MKSDRSTENPPQTQVAVTEAVSRPAGRPLTPPPEDAAERIRQAAKTRSKRGVARALHVHHSVFNRWLREHPELQEAFDDGWSSQEQEYVDVLREIAMNPKRERDQVLALFFLLKARFGWREGNAIDGGRASNVIINLPAAQAPGPLPAARPAGRVIEMRRGGGND